MSRSCMNSHQVRSYVTTIFASPKSCDGTMLELIHFTPLTINKYSYHGFTQSVGVASTKTTHRLVCVDGLAKSDHSRCTSELLQPTKKFFVVGDNTVATDMQSGSWRKKNKR